MHGVFNALLKEKAGESFPVTEEEAEPIALKRGQIAVDIYEEEGYLIIKAPIAGVKLADLDIDVAENEVTIRGSRAQTDDLEEGQYILQECYWGDFERTVLLPVSVNPAKVKATFSKDNILKIFIPKEGGRKVRIVKINEGG